MVARRAAVTAVTAVGVTVTLLLLGVVLGWVWSRLAPGEATVMLSGGRTVALPTESNHLFDGVGLFTLMGLGAGLVSGAALWQWRSCRGPVLLLTAVAASLLSAWVAYRCGLLFAGHAGTGAAVGTLVEMPPVLSSVIVIVAQPLGVALAYGFATALSGDTELGRDADGVRTAPAEVVSDLSSGSAAP